MVAGVALKALEQDELVSDQLELIIPLSSLF